MAWLRGFPTCAKCERKATCELLNARNAVMAAYCDKHGKQEEAKLRAAEKREQLTAEENARKAGADGAF
jgi:lysyl-tRNA synthetase class I